MEKWNALLNKLPTIFSFFACEKLRFGNIVNKKTQYYLIPYLLESVTMGGLELRYF